MSRKNKRKPNRTRSKTDNSCQTAEIEFSDNSTQTEVIQFQSVPQNSFIVDEFEALGDLEDYSVIRADVDFGSGPRMTPYARGGANIAYNTGNNLDVLVGNVNIAPSVVCGNTMGYMDVENVHSAIVGAKLQEKKTFQEYLRNCCMPDSAGNLPLHIEVMRNDFNEVRKQALMINLWKLPIDTINANHLTPLHLAVIHNCDESVVRFLLERDADLSCTDAEGNNAIHLAVFHNSLSLLRVLLQRATQISFGLNTFNYEGFSPLLLATIEDKFEMVKIFLEFEANPNVKDQKSGRTPLFHAVENNNLKMVQLLLKNDADKKIKNFSGTSTHDAVFELEGISADIKNIIIGKELFAVNSTRVDKRKKPTDKTKEVCTKKLKTVKTYRKIKV